MPCDQVIYNSVSFEEATGHLDLLADALREQGYSVQQYGETLQFSKNGLSGTYANGKFNTQQSAYSEAKFDVDAVKVSFSTGVVKKSAAQKGWKVKSLGNNKYQIVKGY